MRKYILFFLLTIPVSVSSQIKVRIGDLYYNISGTTASVAANRSYYYEDDYKIVYRCNYRNSEYSIPSSVNYNGYDYPVVSIDEGAFADQVKYFSDGKTSYYSNLLSPINQITIPSSIIHIGAYAFYGRSYLKTLPNVQNIDEYAFYSSSFNTFSAPNLKSIGKYAFADNRYLTNIEISNVEMIDEGAFNKCSKLESIIAPKTKIIAESAFSGCSNLSMISLLQVESIGSKAFSSCDKITSVLLPASLQSMEEDVFSSCPLLRELFYLSHTPPTNWIATTKTYVPDKLSYSSPKNIINDGKVIEMVTYKTNNFDYTGQPPTSTWDNNVSGYNATLSLLGVNKNAGAHEEWVPVTFTKGETSFICDVIFRYSINPITLTLHASQKNREYGEENPVLLLSYIGFVNGENESVITKMPTINTTATKKSDVGEYPITISGGEAQNYTFAYEPGVLTVTKAPLTVKVNDETKQYGKDNPIFSVSYTGLKNDETAPKWTEGLKIETSATNLSGAGTYDITATGVPTNYDLPIIEKGTLTITQAPLIIKANNATRKYYEADPEFEYTCFGFVNGDDEKLFTKAPILATEATKTSSVGTYKITPIGAEAKNYNISYEQGELAITKRILKATSHATRMYGEDNPLLPIEYDGFVNNETESVLSKNPIGISAATKTSTVGEYPITLSGGEATNYEFIYEQGVLTVNKAPLSAKVKDATKVYGKPNPAFSIEYYGLKNDETVPAWTIRPTFQTEATNASGVGQYVVKSVNGIAVNYDLYTEDGTLTITPAPLTIKANNVTRQYYTTNPTLSYSCIGFVSGEDKSVLTAEPTLTTTANIQSNVGTYEIEISGASSPNYIISYQNGTLTITKAPLLISVGDYTKDEGDDNPEFTLSYLGFKNGETESVLTQQPTISCSATSDSPAGAYPINISDAIALNYEISYTNGILTVKEKPNNVVVFSDAVVKALCVMEWDSNGDGELSKQEAAAVKDLGTIFKNNKKIESFKELSFFKGLTSIKEDVFNGCSALSSISIPEFVTSIGSRAFYGCTVLKEVEINSNDVVSKTYNTSYSLKDIFGKQVKDYTIGENVTSIGDYAFYNCSGLTEVTIPNSITSIGVGSFQNCTGLITLTVPNNVTSIGVSAFYGTSLNTFIVGSGVLSLGNNAFSTKPIKTIWLTNTPPKNYVVAQGTVNYVANSQYSSLSNVKEYKFLSSIFDEDGVRYVPVSPSERTCDVIDCTYDELISEINIKAAVSFMGVSMKIQSVQPYAFYKNNNLQQIKYGIGGSICKYVFYGCVNLLTAELGQDITGIEESAFRGCAKLKGIIVPDAVGTIGQYAFSGCSGMKTVTIGKGTNNICQYAFSGCSEIESISIGKGTETISNNAFQDCSKLAVITIPGSVTSVGNYAFSGCTGLKNVFMADRETEGALSLGYNGSNPLFADCPLDSVYIGRNISYNKNSSYGYSPFYRNTSLRSIVITDKEEDISENEFYGCTDLQNVQIGDGVTSIGNWAFSGCSSLRNFSFGTHVKTIGQEAFSDCIGVTAIISKATMPPSCGSQALDDINKWKCLLYVPIGTLSAYKAADQWKEFFFMEEGNPFANPRGDANGDDKVDMDDAKFVTNIILGIEEATETADVNRDGVINMSDVMFIVNFIKNGEFPDE